jgi:hypothetical protein
MFWESVTIHRHPGNPRPLYLNIPSYTSWYCTSHMRCLAHNPRVPSSNLSFVIACAKPQRIDRYSQEHDTANPTLREGKCGEANVMGFSVPIKKSSATQKFILPGFSQCVY